MATDSITRRAALRAGVASGIVLATPQLLSAAAAAAAADVKIADPVRREGKPFRIAHLTDMHVTEKHNAQAGYAAALQSLKRIDPAPELLLTGGDHIMDALMTTRERAVEQWDMYGKRSEEHTSELQSPCNL